MLCHSQHDEVCAAHAIPSRMVVILLCSGRGGERREVRGKEGRVKEGCRGESREEGKGGMERGGDREGEEMGGEREEVGGEGRDKDPGIP